MIESLTIGRTLDVDRSVIENIVRKAKCANSVSVAFFDDELHLILSSDGKPLAKIPADIALSAVDNFMDDLSKVMNNS
jgi:hypothetical protein